MVLGGIDLALSPQLFRLPPDEGEEPREITFSDFHGVERGVRIGGRKHGHALQSVAVKLQPANAAARLRFR